MSQGESRIHLIARTIFEKYVHLFPSPYPDIPLNANMLKEALRDAGLEVEEDEVPNFMAGTELKLAGMVPLNWNNYGTIAILLFHNQPGEDPVNVSYTTIKKLVKALPNFSDDADPDPDTLDSVIYTWISLIEEDPVFWDEDAWD